MTAAGGQPVVAADGVVKRYRRGAAFVHALRAAGLELHPGEVVALVGPSGSGKSTLLGVLCGWEVADAGDLRWAAELAAPDPARIPWSRLAIVPQTLGLLEELSVAENVDLPARLAGVDAGNRVVRLLDRFGLAELADRLPGETSLGEQQRTAVARALLLEPRLVLADEPATHQDAHWAAEVYQSFRDAATAGAACLVATHDPAGLAYYDRVLELTDGVLRPARPR